ncbi:MAG: CBASS cGAMP-activated phospholipase [Chloroflexota bacterium]
MEDRFQILALDGGGIKGLFSAAILSFLEDDLNIKIVDHFDLIVGTSTGGLIALGLGVGLSPADLVDFYVEHGPAIFPGKFGLGLKQYIRRKYDPYPLEKALRSCFQEKRLADCTKRLVIPAYNIGEDDVYLFKTPHHERLKRDWKVPLWKVGMATSAAPTYFPAFTKVDHVRLVDGGVWANNPTMVGITEAVSLLGQPLDSIRIFSLGTTDVCKGRSGKLDTGGFLQWRKDGLEVVMRGQSVGTHTQAMHLVGPENVHRLDPRVPDGLFALDKLSKEGLISKAAHESRHFAPKFTEVFADHRAPEFNPIHGQGVQT